MLKKEIHLNQIYLVKTDLFKNPVHGKVVKKLENSVILTIEKYAHEDFIDVDYLLNKVVVSYNKLTTIQ